jgi:cyclopropane fatty-acyl-phospholipid synthase-like methyltransferase
VERMLEIAGVEEGEKVYDLGCGDGRVLFTAASKYGAYGVGYEIRDGLVRYVRNRVHGLGLDNYITVFRKDLAKADLTGANIVTLYLTTPMLRTQRPPKRRPRGLPRLPNTRFRAYGDT